MILGWPEHPASGHLMESPVRRNDFRNMFLEIIKEHG
jgi:hypothetical protein